MIPKNEGPVDRAIGHHEEDPEMATVSAFTDNNLNGQGFGYLDQEAKSRYGLPLRFTPAVCTILIVIGHGLGFGFVAAGWKQTGVGWGLSHTLMSVVVLLGVAYWSWRRRTRIHP